MRYAYKVWHSEQHKSAAKRATGRTLEEDEIRISHENIEPLVGLSYELEPRIDASVMLLSPSSRGVIVLLDTEGGEDEADDSIARCLSRINRLDPDICFIAEPLPV
jgi:hypothetical protein